ncbi:hypothetical protein [Xanthomonas sp. 4461]|uniref:hypothetical protein n=1 Tax=Xanthomonas sp. 4461 TaxID=3035313 RepID=UPI0021694907|nr:hypothetical protein [Xanthomonas sp. 4461]MCS3807856.1 hypothetical protein [Xanthomonas sp. 4461]
MADGSRSLPRQSRNNGLAVGGRPIRVPVGKATVRQLLKRHLLEEGKRIQDLAAPWQCCVQNVYDRFCKGGAIAPGHIDAAIAFLRLDEFDAAELRLLGAREAGWNIDTQYLLPEKTR